jgi:hypothetical protein
MRTNLRDAIVLGVLLAAAVAGRLAWHRLSPWISLAIAVTAALATIAIYSWQPAPHASAESTEAEPEQKPLTLHGE